MQPNVLQVLMLAVLGLVIVVFVVFGAMARAAVGGRGAGAALVLRKFDLNEEAQNGFQLRIVGRIPGLVGWLLTIIGLVPVTTMVLNREDLSIERTSLRGVAYHLAPLRQISSTYCSYTKPIGLLFFGGLFVFAGIVGGLLESSAAVVLGGLLVGGLFLVAYWLRKSLTIGAMAGVVPFAIAIRPSVIENLKVDLSTAQRAIRLINRRVTEATTRVDGPPPWGSPNSPDKGAPPAGPVTSPPLGSCVHCGSVVHTGATFCGECGSPVQAVGA